MALRIGALVTGVFSVRSFSVRWVACLAAGFSLLGAPAVLAQAPPPQPAAGQPTPRPLTGFVPAFEIIRTVRGAGLNPLSPPLREGTTYVLRATDFRGILVRVVVDARTGALRDVARIVPANPDQIGMMAPPYYGAPRRYPPPYGPPPYGPPPYGAPSYYDGGTPEEDIPPPPGSLPHAHPAVSHQPAVLPPATRPASTRPSTATTPLPRPRPKALASRTPGPAPAPVPASEPKSGVTAAAPAASTTPNNVLPDGPVND